MALSEPTAAPEAATELARVNAERLVLGAILLAIFVVPTSISGTAVALPSIATDTQATLSSLQWVATAFNLTFACFTLAWGAVADIVGRKRAFTAGIVLYALASAVSATAHGVVLLDVARALAGIGAAAIFAAGSAILSTTFDGAARLRAFALAGAMAGIGVAVGPTLSGWFVDAFGWRSIFVFHTVALLVVLAIVPFVRERGPALRPGARIDGAGTAIFVVSLSLLIVGIVQTSQWGWLSAGVLGLFAAFVAGMALFVAVERRQAQPMLDLSLLRNRAYVGWCLGTLVPSFGFFTLLTYLPSYLTTVASDSARSAGLIMLLLALPLFLCPVIAGKLVANGKSPVAVMVGGLICLILGDASLSVIGPHVSALVFALPMLLVGAGMGLSAGLVDGQALQSVEPEKAGMAAGFLNTLRLGSETIAIAMYAALLGTVLHATARAGIGAFSAADPGRAVDSVAAGNVAAALQAVPAAQRDAFHAFLIGSYDTAFHGVLWILMGICIVLTLAILLLLRRPKPAG